ncbi:MAG: hypothetical protein PHN49_05890 [Candidatus Omnitrophica bacterium]|nr:hypothetical protein [Candidatus Omnitrophota bacterium]MDD5671149.1 hypothetical protein [Candidatus Omnitrophota bacterium]
MRALTVVLVIFAIVLAPALSFAASPWTEEDTYGKQIGSKLQFGLVNTLLGWTEIINEPNRALNEKTDSLTGLGKGVSNALVDTVGGVLHLVTFPIPQLDIPLPNNGVNIGKKA